MVEDLSSELKGLEKRLKDAREESGEIKREGIFLRYEAESVSKGSGEKLLSKVGLLPKEPKVRLEEVVLAGTSQEEITPERGEEAKDYLEEAGYEPALYKDLEGSLKRIQWKRDGKLRTVQVYDGDKEMFVSEKDHPELGEDLSFQSIPLGEIQKDVLPVMETLQGKEVEEDYSKWRKLENELGGPATSRAKVLSVLTFLGGYGIAYGILQAISPGTANGHKAFYELVSGGMTSTTLYKDIKKKLKHKIYGRTN